MDKNRQNKNPETSNTFKKRNMDDAEITVSGDVVNHFKKQIEAIGITLTNAQLEEFEVYAKNLYSWNKVMNLTAITQAQEIYTKHFLDSLTIVGAIPQDQLATGLSVIDVGTGAGFPGLPIAISFPQIHVVLMDSLQKRCRFLQDTVNKLGISNVDVIHGRAEDLARNKQHRENYDICVSRAVANLSTLSEYCLPFVKKGGYFLAYKSEKVSEEIKSGSKAVSILGGTVDQMISFQLPYTDYGRVLVLIRKDQNTPGRYPRKAGTPSKEPIT